MFKANSQKLIEINPRAAEKYLLINDFPAQRPERPNWSTTLANYIREGLFLVGDIGVATLEYEKGRRVLVNGQHQCNAVIIANKKMTAVLSEFTCHDPDDTSLLYRQFDNHHIRSLGAKVKVELHALGLPWPVRCGSLLVSAAALVEGKKSAHPNVRIELLSKYLKQGQFLHELIFTSNGNGTNIQKDYAHLRRQPVIYAILLTWKKSQSDSKVFWEQVRDGEGLKRTMPTYKLRNFLMQYNFDKGAGAKGAPGRVVTLHEMTSKCITAWNAYRQSKPTNLKYYSSKPIPKAL